MSDQRNKTTVLLLSSEPRARAGLREVLGIRIENHRLHKAAAVHT